MITNYLKMPHTLSQREIDIRLIAIMYQKINKKDYDFASHKNANIMPNIMKEIILSLALAFTL